MRELSKQAKKLEEGKEGNNITFADISDSDREGKTRMTKNHTGNQERQTRCMHLALYLTHDPLQHSLSEINE